MIEAPLNGESDADVQSTSSEPLKRHSTFYEEE
jgi:hypothetical protein